MAPSEAVRLYPTGTAFIDNVPAVEQDVTPERAQELLAYFPPAFTVDPPQPPASPAETPKELSSDA